ncbi:MAG: DHH family phosphoesterase, partial [Holophagae bacterium]|nr:DHH family phosphoesterase [Holophagae bacterium]
MQMKGMEEAVARIHQAIKGEERVIIYGDYDADGITSVAVLKRALELLGLKIDYYIPRRLEDGYGLREEAFEKISAEGYSLVITVDCGIRAVKCAEYAGKLGLDLIITDHHLPEEQTPTAVAVIKPRQDGCQYPYKDLAGVGVVFKLVQALFSSVDKDDLVSHFLKLVAIGTIADRVPLTGENRAITFWGLKGLANPRNLGLKALLSGSGTGFEVSSQDVGFKIAPRINAYTRMEGGSEIVELFFMTDQRRIDGLVREMNEKNNARKYSEGQIIREIEDQLELHPVSPEDNFLLFYGKGWHKGIIGIVASRMT